MKKLTLLAVAIASVFALGTASAGQPTAEMAWSCTLDGSVSGARVGFIIGAQTLKGPGVISCVSADGDYVSEANVNISIVGIGVGLGLTRIKNMSVNTFGVGVVGGPAAMMGSYRVGASTGYTFINHGYDVDAAIQLSKQGLGFEVALTGEDATGIGAHLHGMIMNITPAN